MLKFIIRTPQLFIAFLIIVCFSGKTFAYMEFPDEKIPVVESSFAIGIIAACENGKCVSVSNYIYYDLNWLALWVPSSNPEAYDDLNYFDYNYEPRSTEEIFYINYRLSVYGGGYVKGGAINDYQARSNNTIPYTLEVIADATKKHLKGIFFSLVINSYKVDGGKGGPYTVTNVTTPIIQPIKLSDNTDQESISQIKEQALSAANTGAAIIKIKKIVKSSAPIFYVAFILSLLIFNLFTRRVINNELSQEQLAISKKANKLIWTVFDYALFFIPVFLITKIFSAIEDSHVSLIYPDIKTSAPIPQAIITDKNELLLRAIPHFLINVIIVIMQIVAIWCVYKRLKIAGLPLTYSFRKAIHTYTEYLFWLLVAFIIYSILHPRPRLT